MHQLTHVGCHANDDVGHDVGADEIVGTASVHVTQEIRRVAVNVRKSAVLDVLARYANGHGINVVGKALPCPKAGGADGEDTASRAHVEHAAALGGILLQELNDQARGLVRARTKGHAGVHAHDQLARGRLILLPCGNDHQLLADLDGLVIGLPGVGPILLVYADGLHAGVRKPSLQKALAQEGETLGNAPLGRQIDRDRGHGLVGVENALVDQISIAGLQINVAVILDLQVVGDHAHHGGQRVKLLQLDRDADLRPLGLRAVVAAQVILIHAFPHFCPKIFLKNCLCFAY